MHQKENFKSGCEDEQNSGEEFDCAALPQHWLL